MTCGTDRLTEARNGLVALTT